MSEEACDCSYCKAVAEYGRRGAWLGDSHYQQAAAAERAAEQRVRDLAAQMWAAADPIKHWGDGRGGYVMDLICDVAGDLFWSPSDSAGPKVPWEYTWGDERSWSAIRRFVFERDEYRCRHCGSWKELNVDHVHPRSRGGSDDPENLQTLCGPCNRKKGAKLPS